MKQSRDKPVILVVDDQERNLQVVGSTLAGADYEVVPAMSGEQALTRLEAVCPDLILLDVMMPGIDGIETCRRLQEIPEVAEVPIIFLSAADEQEVVLRALEAGGVDFVTKPFNKAELLLRVRTHVELKEARDRLEELLAMREEFMGVLAHDLKNPLSGIRFSAQLLEEKREALPENLCSLASTILDGANHMFEFIDQFLEDKAREDASFSVDLKPVDAVTIVEGVVRRHRAEAARKEIGLIVETPPNPCIVKADGGALEQVLANLISNALKFSSSGTAVKVRFLPTGEDHIQILVRDQGPGFTEADQEQVFQRFVRLSAKPTGGETSTGLGLSIVKRLVGMMGGEVSLKSEPSQGAEFAMCLKACGDSSLVE